MITSANSTDKRSSYRLSHTQTQTQTQIQEQRHHTHRHTRVNENSPYLALAIFDTGSRWYPEVYPWHSLCRSRQRLGQSQSHRLTDFSSVLEFHWAMNEHRVKVSHTDTQTRWQVNTALVEVTTDTHQPVRKKMVTARNRQKHPLRRLINPVAKAWRNCGRNLGEREREKKLVVLRRLQSAHRGILIQHNTHTQRKCRIHPIPQWTEGDEREEVGRWEEGGGGCRVHVKHVYLCCFAVRRTLTCTVNTGLCQPELVVSLSLPPSPLRWKLTLHTRASVPKPTVHVPAQRSDVTAYALRLRGTRYAMSNMSITTRLSLSPAVALTDGGKKMDWWRGDKIDNWFLTPSQPRRSYNLIIRAIGIDGCLIFNT